MAARQTRLIALAACGALLLLPACSGGARSDDGQAGNNRPSPADRAQTATRIVSLVPALTEMLFLIGAGPQVVGVSNFDEFPPAVKTLPRVGALLDPDTERILTLHPDFIITYGSQDDARMRFERAGIRVFTYRHGDISDVLETLRRLGAATGHSQAADDAAQELQTRIDGLRDRVQDRTRPRTVLVFGRTPQTLRGMFVSGGTGFMNDMLETAGASNVFADVKRESVEPSQELLLARAPDVIIEVRANGLLDPANAASDRSVWKALASIPAVRTGRIFFLAGQEFVVPGPRLVDGIETLARTLHPEAFR